MATLYPQLEFNPTSMAVTLLDPLEQQITIIRREALVYAAVDGRWVRVMTVGIEEEAYDLGSEETAKAVWADIAARDSSAPLWVREPDGWGRR